MINNLKYIFKVLHYMKMLATYQIETEIKIYKLKINNKVEKNLTKKYKFNFNNRTYYTISKFQTVDKQVEILLICLLFSKNNKSFQYKQ